jgi:hypothetical protein
MTALRLATRDPLPLIVALIAALIAAPAEAAAQPAEPAPDAAAVAARIARLEADNRRLHEAVEQLREHQTEVAGDVAALRPLSSRFTGYLDVGLFWVGGDGSGIRTDLGNRVFPEYAGVVPDSWVFMGDPLSTMINARGEPADTSESRAITFDPIASRGAPTFLINSLNFGVFRGVTDATTLDASIDFLPRGRDVSNPDGLFLGDYLDVKLAYVEHRPALDSVALSLYAGKFDSVLGIEYRSQDAPDRLAATPSLICRYTCGRPLGLKARAELLDQAIAVNVAVTNGSHASEGFPLGNETDTNQMKTVAGRVSYHARLGSGFEVGASGAFGAQDLQPADDIYQWHIGADVHLDWHDLDISGEIVRGRAPGLSEAGEPECGLAPCLDYKGAYGQAGYRATNRVTPYLRVDWRSAVHRSGASFVYVSDVARATAGLHVELGAHTVIKAEYTLNRELGRVPEIADDIFTSSMVVRY